MDILSKNLLILASAGSGKTFQLGTRVIGLVARGVPPERIVALTFTRKAAGEFADSVLTKLAVAASDESAATRLRAAIHTPDAEFKEVLERVVKALPRLTFGTMDGFFSRIVRTFQYELGLTGGRFDLLEGPRAAALADEMLSIILGDTTAHGRDDGFFHAFRRATIGKEKQSVLSALRSFVQEWQNVYQESCSLEWGPAALSNMHPDEWVIRKSKLEADVLANLSRITFTDKRQQNALEKAVEALGNHIIGSGSLNDNASLLDSILEAIATQDGPLRVKSYKEFIIDGPACDALRALVELAARCEMSAALLRTRAVREVVTAYDDLCAEQLRRKGLLGFNDVKVLMGEWATSESARLRREAVDFRLDARTDHWLLDEFQDTSRADWNGLLPLIDEAVSGEDSTLFIVGDRKQAIYGWRGGNVGLFDEVASRYGSGLETAPMIESWRSCPEVLSLVNQVCGDIRTMHSLFGDVTSRWKWLDHVSAAPLTQPDKRGQARVEVIAGKWEERLQRLPELLHELGVGKRAMTCGILVRENKKAHEVTDLLRSQGFDVIEEGCREPAKDNPVGIFIFHLLRWLADPADSFAREVIEMSPLSAVLKAMHGPSWREIWVGLTDNLSKNGFAQTVGSITGAAWEQWSDFGRRRAGDLLETLATLDSQGGVSPREAADWVGRMEISQNPGVAAVQVMTIHKAKGLGFDVVILPDISSKAIPQSNYFNIARDDYWLTQPPPRWARAMIPEMREAEARWAGHQQYEAFCMLYVALTRAKRGLYVLLQAPAQSTTSDRSSLANWMIQSIGSDAATGVIYQNGTSDWPDNLAFIESAEKTGSSQVIGAAIPRRARMNPSRLNKHEHPSFHSPMGMKYGTEVHALLEQVGWADESPPVLPDTDAAKTIAQLLRSPEMKGIFEKQGRTVELFREQPVDAIMDGNLFSGVIDRLHVHRDSAGCAIRVEIIDFKTDAVKDADELIGRHSGQMNAYRAVMEKIYPNAEVRCALLSVRHSRMVAI